MKTYIQKFLLAQILCFLVPLPKKPIQGVAPFETERREEEGRGGERKGEEEERRKGEAGREERERELKRIYARARQSIKGKNAFACHISVIFLLLTMNQSTNPQTQENMRMRNGHTQILHYVESLPVTGLPKMLRL